MDNGIVIEEILCKWDNFESPMLQTEVHPALQPDQMACSNSEQDHNYVLKENEIVHPQCLEDTKEGETIRFVLCLGLSFIKIL